MLSAPPNPTPDPPKPRTKATSLPFSLAQMYPIKDGRVACWATKRLQCRCQEGHLHRPSCVPLWRYHGDAGERIAPMLQPEQVRAGGDGERVAQPPARFRGFQSSGGQAGAVTDVLWSAKANRGRGGQGGAVEGTERVKQARGDLCLMALPFNGERSGGEGGSEKQGRGTLWVTQGVLQRGRQ